MEQHIADAYAAATKILLDCRHPRNTLETKLKGSGTARFCSDCWNSYVAARKAARKAQLAIHAAELPDCEGTHGKPVKARWTMAGVQLCGRCKTKAKTNAERKVLQSGTAFLFMMGGATLTRAQVLDALR